MNRFAIGPIIDLCERGGNRPKGGAKSVDFLLSLLLALSVLLPRQGICVGLDSSRAASFVSALLAQDSTLGRFVSAEERAHSERLGIRYTGVPNKFLIGYDIPAGIREDVRAGARSYEFSVREESNGVSILELSISGLAEPMVHYFQNGHWISPIRLHTASWNRSESIHFVFLTSGPSRMNPYAVSRLEDFLTHMLDVLQVSPEKRDRLRKEKIHYILCQDEEEISAITGQPSRGRCFLGSDCVVTVWPCHYHELVHLLVNYALGEHHLYTHPFFQEGAAVAFGGRGGKEPPILLDLGSYLAKSGMVDYTDLLDPDSFYSHDASMTYPASGLYCHFLVGELGAEAYLDLYQEYSCDEGAFRAIDPEDLPDDARWRRYLDGDGRFRTAWPAVPSDIPWESGPGPWIRVADGEMYYVIAIPSTLLVGAIDAPAAGESRRYREVFGEKPHQGEKYLLLAGSDELSVYNLFTDNLTAKYVAAFSDPPAPIIQIGSLWFAHVCAGAFDELPESLYPISVDGR